MLNELLTLREASTVLERLRSEPALVERVDDAGAALLRLMLALEGAGRHRAPALEPAS